MTMAYNQSLIKCFNMAREYETRNTDALCEGAPQLSVEPSDSADINFQLVPRLWKDVMAVCGSFAFRSRAHLAIYQHALELESGIVDEVSLQFFCSQALKDAKLFGLPVPPEVANSRHHLKEANSVAVKPSGEKEQEGTRKSKK